ncbi:MAG: hypothetical protein ACKVU4_08035 [Phycisphaerales bacterium]
MIAPAEARARHHRWLAELTSIPTASGREGRVVAWIMRWVGERAELAITTDPGGNLLVARRGGGGANTATGVPGLRPVLFTAHLDHPAFVVERVIGPGTLQLSFRGGVMDAYFADARIVVHAADGATRAGAIAGPTQAPAAPFKSWLAELDGGTEGVRPGDIATWDLPAAVVRDGLLHAPACDDLAGVAAALAALDVLLELERAGGPSHPSSGGHPAAGARADVQLLFTRAEEIGFAGAIAACRHGTIPRGARVIALENSRAFDESPIGGGPIVRVGDRLSIFSPGLTASIAAVAERIAAGAPRAGDASAAAPRPWAWQRKLMPGGACEASVFCAYGHDATCLCLPLGNYHNMGSLAAVQAGTHTAPPRIEPEVISMADFDGLVDLLVQCGRSLPEEPPIRSRIDRLWDERGFVLDEKP